MEYKNLLMITHNNLLQSDIMSEYLILVSKIPAFDYKVCA